MKWSLPLVLVAALANCLLFFEVIPAWQGPDEHGHFAYIALLAGRNLDTAQVDNYEWWQGGKDYRDAQDLTTSVIGSMDQSNWTRWFRGGPEPGGSALDTAGSVLYWELRQPPSYYVLSAALIRWLKGLGAPIYFYSDPAGALNVIRLVSIALSLLVVALAWLAAVIIDRRRNPWLRLLLPITVALLPMHTFIDSVANNDVLAELAVSALFVTLAALLRWPFGLRGVSLASLVLVIGVLSPATKSSAAAAAAPLLGLGLAVWAGMLAGRVMGKTSARPFHVGRKRAILVPLAMLSLVAGLAFIAIGILFRPDGTAAGWQTGDNAYERAPRVRSNTAHQGSYVLQMTPGRTFYQWVDIPTPHPPLNLMVVGWARLSRPQTDVAARTQLLTMDGAQGVGAAWLDPAGAWTPITATITVPAGAGALLVRFQGDSAAAPIQFDDLSLSAKVNQEAETPAGYRPDLSFFNSSAETGGRSLLPAIAQKLPAEPRAIVDVLANPQRFDTLAVWQHFAGGQFQSFWGSFGWLSIPLPMWAYTLLQVLSMLALLGVVASAVTRAGRWSGAEWLMLVSAVAIGACALIDYTRQMVPLTTAGTYSAPQGRYIFVLMIPIAWLMLSGLWSVWSAVVEWARRGLGALGLRPPAEDEAARFGPWGAWLWGCALFLFAAYCLLVVIAPYYYSI